MRRQGCLTLVLAVLSLAACAARVPLDRQAAAAVQRVGVVTPAMPEGPNSRIRHTPGLHLGLAGGIADAVMEAERSRQLAAALAARGFDARARWEQILTAALTQAGFTVVPVAATRPDGRMLERYPEAPVDSVLDVSVRVYGYQAATIATPFVPFAHVRARLAAPDGRVLMEEEFQVGPDRPVGLGQFTFVASSTERAFARSAEVPADPDRAVAGVEEAMTVIATQIARSLRPPPS